MPVGIALSRHAKSVHSIRYCVQIPSRCFEQVAAEVYLELRRAFECHLMLILSAVSTLETI